MLWREARDSALQQWTAIQDSVGLADPVDLLTDVNAVTSTCERAKEGGGGQGKCDYCIIYQQFGSCKEFSGRLSEKIAEKEWPGMRAMISTVINALERLELPDEPKVAIG